MINVNIMKEEVLPSFDELSKEIPLSEPAQNTIFNGRNSVIKHLQGKTESKEILVIVGPCSVHNTDEAYEYAVRLSDLKKKLGKHITILMRVCGDKPRTRRGWGGFMKDPHLDGTADVTFGLREMRKLMLRINELGVPVATEALNPIAFNIISDLVSYAWIGARTISDPEKRALATGISVPIGLKNPDQGKLSVAIDAIDCVGQPGIFIGTNEDGRAAKIITAGNPYPHLILRGSKDIDGNNHPNYDSDSIKKSCTELAKEGFINRVIVDCSHGNCNGDYLNQIKVAKSLKDQINGGETGIAGLMLESYFKGGKQDSKKLGTPDGASSVLPEISVTDACLSWEDTETLILGL